MSRLSHPNCVSVIDFGVDGSPYLVMDFVTGKTLREILLGLGGGRFEPARALRIVRQLLAGLGYAHAQGIVHRDLKPENLILSDEPGLTDHLRILDFGLAKLRDGPAMTAGLAVGTPSYMSPEQTGADGAIDARTDLYAVGVLLFELLAGRKPFQSENVGELLLMHRERPAPLLRAAAPTAGLSAALEAVVAKALAKFADDRFQSAAELTAALDATPEGRGVAPPAAARRASGERHAAVAARRRPARPDARARRRRDDRRFAVEDRAPRGRPGARGAGGRRAARAIGASCGWAIALGTVAVAALLVGRALRTTPSIRRKTTWRTAPREAVERDVSGAQCARKRAGAAASPPTSGGRPGAPRGRAPPARARRLGPGAHRARGPARRGARRSRGRVPARDDRSRAPPLGRGHDRGADRRAQEPRAQVRPRSHQGRHRLTRERRDLRARRDLPARRRPRRDSVPQGRRPPKIRTRGCAIAPPRCWPAAAAGRSGSWSSSRSSSSSSSSSMFHR